MARSASTSTNNADGPRSVTSRIGRLDRPDTTEYRLRTDALQPDPRDAEPADPARSARASRSSSTRFDLGPPGPAGRAFLFCRLSADAPPFLPRSRRSSRRLPARSVLSAMRPSRRRRPPRPRRSAPPRDIVLVTIDTLRYDAVGFDGNPRGTTPNLDRIAARGPRLLRRRTRTTSSPSPLTRNILTGLYPYQHGVRENAGFRLSPKVETIATMPQGEGVRDGRLRRRLPLDSRLRPRPRGFDVYEEMYKQVDEPRGLRDPAGAAPKRSWSAALAWFAQDGRASRASSGSTSTTRTRPTIPRSRSKSRFPDDLVPRRRRVRRFRSRAAARRRRARTARAASRRDGRPRRGARRPRRS